MYIDAGTKVISSNVQIIPIAAEQYIQGQGHSPSILYSVATAHVSLMGISVSQTHLVTYIAQLAYLKCSRHLPLVFGMPIYRGNVFCTTIIINIDHEHCCVLIVNSRYPCFRPGGDAVSHANQAVPFLWPREDRLPTVASGCRKESLGSRRVRVGLGGIQPLYTPGSQQHVGSLPGQYILVETQRYSLLFGR